MKTVLKVLAALAAVAGAVYVIATYGDRIVAWAKKLLSACPCTCECDGECTCECDGECTCECEATEEAIEEPAAEEVAEEPAVEEAIAEESTVEATEADFAEEA